MNIDFNSLNAIRITANSTTGLSTSAATIAMGNTAYQKGTGLTRVGNTVVIGEGITSVLIVTNLIADSGPATYFFPRIRRTKVSGFQEEVASALGGFTSGFCGLSMAIVLDVTPGEVIDLRADIGSGTASISNGRPQSLSVVQV